MPQYVPDSANQHKFRPMTAQRQVTTFAAGCNPHASCRMFPEREVLEADGSRRRVVLHCELVRYLQAKSGGLTDHLKFQGRNVCVFGRVLEST